MSSRPGKRVGGIHEGPLILFTALAAAGGGVGTAHLLRVGAGGAGWAFARTEALLLSGLLALALLSSLFHLGRPLRGLLALRRVGSSPLSREVAVVGVALAAGVIAAWAPPGSGGTGALGGVIALASVGTLLSLGLVYRFPHQPSWGGPAVVQPLVQGTLWGWVVTGAVPGLHEGSLQSVSPGWVFWLLLLADGGVFLSRLLARRRAPAWAGPSHPALLPARGVLLFSRLLLSNLLPPLLLLQGLGALAAFSLSAGILLDRLAFYGLARKWTPEGEISAVEALL